MNLTNDISFSGNLIENETCTITYSGFLFKNNSESVSIVYGFDSSWNNTTELEMQKTENGFVAEIKILSFSNLNFCFRNSNYEWDNNYNNNFTVPITKKEAEENFIINEEIIDTLVENVTKCDIGLIEDDTINLADEEVTLGSDLAEPQSEENTNIDAFEVAPENEEHIEIEDSIGNIVQETSLDLDIDKLFDEFYQEETNQDEQNVSEAKFSEDVSDLEEDNVVNSLIDDLISGLYEKTSVVEQEEKVTEPSLIENNIEEETTNNEEAGTTALVETDNLDNYLVSPRSLNKFYMIKKKIKLAFLKVLALPRIILSNLGGENNN